MQPLERMSRDARSRIRGVLTDIDDTLTDHGKLPAAAFGALERLQRAGLLVVPITGRPAGWSDHIARMWPVDAVVGENGAFYMRYDRHARKLLTRFALDATTRTQQRARLDAAAERVLARFPGAALASDQPYRLCDLAIDYCEDVPPLAQRDVDAIVAQLRGDGLTAKVSSIHVNAWLGEYDKCSTSLLMLREVCGIGEDAARGSFVFVGDSPNDEPMFAAFRNSVGVANIRRFEDALEHRPAYVTRECGARGFVELAQWLTSG